MWDSCATTWTKQASVSGTDTTAYDFFGSSVSLSGDTLLVGANYKAQSSASGAAYVFTRSGTTWTQLQKLTPVTGAQARFGFALAQSGTTIAVGSPLGKDPSSVVTYTGVVSIYTKGMNGLYAYKALPMPAEIAHNDNYGYSVSLESGTLVAGAPGAQVWSTNAGTTGKAWIFTGSGSTWTQAAYLTPADGAVDDWFGKSVAQSGTTVIVGAPANDGAGTDAGAAYVYSKVGSTWTFVQKLTASDATAGANFGFTVAAVSSTRVIVGAPGASKLYSFSLVGSTWTEDAAAYTACSNTAGTALAVSGNYAITGKTAGTVFDLTDPDTTCVP